MEKPPVIIRLCAMNCLSSSEIAGPGPRDPTLRRKEAPLLFAGQQRLAVVQLTQEIQPRLRGLDRVEHLETGARQPAWDVDAAEHVVGHEVGGRRRRGWQAGSSADAARVSTGAPNAMMLARSFDRRYAAVLVGEHAALRVAGQVDVAAGDLLDGVDGLAQRDDVVGEVAVHAALDLVG